MEADAAPNVQKCTAGLDLETGVSDFTCVENDILLLGDDAGKRGF